MATKPQTNKITVDVAIDFEDEYENTNQQRLLFQFNVRHKTVFLHLLDKEKDKWNLKQAMPFVENEDGIYFWLDNAWVKAQPCTQKLYSDFIAEKALLQ